MAAGGTMPHILRRAVRSLWENLYLNLVSAGVIAAAVLLMGVYLTFQHNLNQLMKGWDREVQVSAYFHPEVTEDRREALAERIESDPRVARVRYVSEDEAGLWLAERVDGLAPVLEELGSDVLPASLEISLLPDEELDARIAELQPLLDPADFAEVDHGSEWVDRFEAFVKAVRLLGTVMGLMILMAALFLVTNTVYLVIYSRRDELEVQKLVGATQGYIVAPFLLEGLAHGVIGSLLALVALRTVQGLLVARLESALGAEALAQVGALPLQWQALLALLGVVLGVGAAMVAVTRFLASAP
jgi:cell division transport system permease protein